MSLDRSSWRGILIVALLIAVFALKGALVAPPRPALGQFDAARALARLERILGDERAHPVDSPADDAVRGRLIAELNAIGLQSRVQEVEDCSGFPGSRLVSCSRVRNVVATVPGRSNGRHLLLNAHYDSTPTGPGAGDDGIGVATLLEVGAILKASPPPRPVTLLFNEGEEWGLNGAAAFVRHDPEAKSVNALVNIDTRGISGPALMYETSDPNGAAIANYASGTRRPYANSISTDFAKLIPNTTDVVKFKPAGWTLLNYGIIGNETRYHSPGDTIAALDRATFAHVGSEVLAATQALASRPDRKNAGAGRVVFTDFAGMTFIHLPLAFAAVMLALLLLAAAVLAWRAKALGRPLLVVAVTVVGGIAAAGIAGTIAGLLRAGDFWRAYPLVPYLAIYATMVLAMAALLARLARKIDRDRLRAASWLLVLLLGTALSMALPGATIFFLIAPAIALAGIALIKRSPRIAPWLIWAGALFQLLMVAELLAAIEMLLIDGPLWAVAPLAALAMLPVLIEADLARLRPALAMVTVAAFGLWIAALIVPRASAERPLGFSVDYFRDASKNMASWAVATKQAPLPENYPGTWRKGVLPYNARTRWISPAPLLPTPVATARLLDSVTAGQGRRIRIALSPGGGNTVVIRFPDEAKVIAFGLPGEAVAVPAYGEPKLATLRCNGRACDGLVIEAVLGDPRPVTVELFSTRFGLPAQGQALLAARPKNAIPQYAPDDTITRSLVRL